MLLSVFGKVGISRLMHTVLDGSSGRFVLNTHYSYVGQCGRTLLITGLPYHKGLRLTRIRTHTISADYTKGFSWGIPAEVSLSIRLCEVFALGFLPLTECVECLSGMIEDET